jgi:hypothetical protein
MLPKWRNKKKYAGDWESKNSWPGRACVDCVTYLTPKIVTNPDQEKIGQKYYS